VKEVKRAILLTVDDLLIRTNHGIPVDLKPLAFLRKINRIWETELSVDAILIPEYGGFLAKVRKKLHPFKKRFAIAHEIGHTFFFNIEIDPPRREFAYQKSNYWVQEEFSCAIAREILVPRFSIIPIVEKEHVRPSLAALRYLSALYQVSFDVLRTRLINDLPLWDCIFMESTVVDGKILTKGRDISKGKSHGGFVMPKAIERNGKLPELFQIISATISEKRLQEKIEINYKKYFAETVLLDAARQSVMTLIVKAQS
jgi:hypothetical protein